MTIKVGNKEFSLDGYVNDFQKVLVEIYQQGRADGIDELENILKDFFKKQNNQKSKFRPSIVMMEEDALNILEQLKEQTNDD